LEKKPEQRYQSASQMRGELRALLQESLTGRVSLAREAFARISLFTSRHTIPVLLGASPAFKGEPNGSPFYFFEPPPNPPIPEDQLPISFWFALPLISVLCLDVARVHRSECL
jgi:hypothetical protein